MCNLDTHVICIQEPNTHWTDTITQPLYRLFQKAFMHAKLAYSACIDTTQTNRQPGGTFMAIVGCYAARVLTTGSDSTGLGRWSYSKLIGKNGRHFLIISAYHVGNQQPTIGSHTSYTQQYHLLLQQGHLTPKPHELFVSNMISFIAQWQGMHDILLCIDANDMTLHSKDHGLDHILEATHLIDLHKYKFPTLPSPPMHHRSRYTIDYCLGTRGFAEALRGAWMLPFGTPATLTRDHHTLGLEFDHDILLGRKAPNTPGLVTHGVYSNAYPTVRRFNDDVASECDHQGLFNAAQQLARKYTFTPDDHQELERIDQALTKILVTADQGYAKHRTNPWSPALHQAFLEHCYWRIRLTEKRTHRNYKELLKNITAQLHQEPAQTGSISQNLRMAQTKLRDIKHDAAAKRDTYLDNLADAAANTNQKAKRKLILQLCLAEQNRKCFNLHWSYMKPRTAGGLTRLLIPDPSNAHRWTMIIEPPAMEYHLMEYCRLHFQQAQGSPYTIPPLSDLLQYDSLTPFGAQILHGMADLDTLNLSPSTKLLLRHQKTWLPDTHQCFQPFPFKAMLTGPRKWPECTSTSPSR